MKTSYPEFKNITFELWKCFIRTYVRVRCYVGSKQVVCKLNKVNKIERNRYNLSLRRSKKKQGNVISFTRQIQFALNPLVSKIQRCDPFVILKNSPRNVICGFRYIQCVIVEREFLYCSKIVCTLPILKGRTISDTSGVSKKTLTTSHVYSRLFS